MKTFKMILIAITFIFSVSTFAGYAQPWPVGIDFDEDGNMFSTSGEDYLTLKYDRLVPLLVEGIKEQTEIIKTQQKEIDELKEMVKLLLNK